MRILLADDQAVGRHGFRSIFESAPGCEVVGEAEDGLQAVALSRRL